MATRATDLTAAQWAVMEPLLPPPNPMGRPRAEDRKTLNGILYVLRTGCRWADLPVHYGHPSTCWRRLEAWQRDGTWEKRWHTLLRNLDAQGKLVWTQAFLDGTFVPAKRGAARRLDP